MDLKIKIIATLVGILIIAMFLMNMAMLHVTQKYLFLSESQKGKLLSDILHREFLYDGPGGIGISDNVSMDRFQSLLEKENCAGVMVVNRHNRRIYRHGDDMSLIKRLAVCAARVLKTGEPRTDYYGTAWGVFWKQPQTSIVSQPIKRSGNTVGAMSLAISLIPALEKKRKIQQITFLYLIINTILFTAVGYFSISRITIKPIRKLTQRATDYRSGDGLLLPYESGNSQWDVLSKAVNRIVALNMADNAKLQETVTSLKTAMGELKKAQREIIRAEKLATVGRLSSGIAHEIGNPIGIILGYLQLLKQEALSKDEKNDFIQRAEEEVRRIDLIIRQLLDYSRPDKVRPSCVSLHDVIEEIIGIVRLQPVFSDINVNTVLSAEQDHVLADPGQLHQAFLNLILNAADAIESDDSGRTGRLDIVSENLAGEHVDMFPDKTCIKLSFIDNGQGIGPESIQQVFDPFFTTKPPGKGTGLGLWVSIMIIEGVGGKLSAESILGEGTTMSLYFPVAPEKNRIGRKRGIGKKNYGRDYVAIETAFNHR